MRRPKDKTRIVVTCPATGVVVITRLTYEEMIRPRARPMLFACACGETHKLLFAGRYPGRREPKQPVDRHRAG
jgi:hypothetical protein